jgi:ABC-type glycerol-3-phosphate transport system substrate-binding protein
MKKLLAIAALSLTLAVMLAGCGGTAEQVSTSAASGNKYSGRYEADPTIHK